MRNEKILSVKICSSKKEEILRSLDKRIKKGIPTVIFTPNTKMLLQANASPAFLKILNSSSLNIPDGSGILIASRMLGGNIKQRITGIDFAASLLALAEKRGYRVFLLGSERGVAKKAKKNLKISFPKLKICGAHHGYFKKSGKENEKLLKKIRSAHPDILFVCLGSPTQEKWITKNARQISSLKLSIGLGGSLDVWAGKVSRAPKLIQIAGLEWLWRTIKEPKRARIFFDIPVFLFKVRQSKKC
jgi:N-acetylglucosaminyldiphosphoundecaprenol N-acetyl-beta-D-mannosaminyltransferase